MNQIKSMNLRNELKYWTQYSYPATDKTRFGECGIFVQVHEMPKAELQI